ncbi:MAG: tRNA lysidine(34) synthetase TilS [Peptoniphilaceae bacterium]|nr:tRNA lysidine(34) synthetase TilS [Peptoniphilaceae bacterium]MDD7383346.1 tRNA lysidine(34) synthetase TilS [Peptoniphilaceae bacterium]MDY3738283.1 tRNA lysidine(34) synthetase TilS [Peptoniphilaceae bacterium]
MRIQTKVFETIKKYNLISQNDNIIIGASGGADSQFLTFILLELKKDIDFNIILAHLNHLHREDSYIDENLVIETAKKNNLDFYVERKNMDDFSDENKLSKEEAGRILRYNFFDKVTKKYSNAKIALAHNLDDQAETVLMRIIRGSGIDGLKAMDYKRDNIIRPILDVSKKEVYQYCKENDIQFHEDYTNKETNYTRNKIRLKVIPMLEEINPNVKKSLVNLSNLAKNDSDILREIDEKLFKKICKMENEKVIFDRKSLENLSIPLFNRVLRYSISIVKGDLQNISISIINDFRKLLKLSSGKKIERKNLIFKKNYENYELSRKTNEKKDTYKFLKLDSEILFNDFLLESKQISYKEYLNHSKKNSYFFDLDKIHFPLVVRVRQNGDKIIPFGMNSHKKIKNIFIDMKIEKEKRDILPLILMGEEILCIVSTKRSNLYKLRKNTEKILMISWRKNEN